MNPLASRGDIISPQEGFVGCAQVCMFALGEVE